MHCDQRLPAVRTLADPNERRAEDQRVEVRELGASGLEALLAAALDALDIQTQITLLKVEVSDLCVETVGQGLARLFVLGQGGGRREQAHSREYGRGDSAAPNGV